MTVRPKPPACDTWIVSIAQYFGLWNAPIRSRMIRLPCESAIGRKAASGRVGGSTSATVSPQPRSETASAAPTGPPPATTTSHSSGTPIAHQRFDVVDALGDCCGQDRATFSGHERVAFDPHAAAPVALGPIFPRPDIAAPLDGERHARLQHFPLPALLVIPGVVDIEAEPMTGPVHVEAPVMLLLQHFIHAAGAQTEIDEALGEHSYGGV